MKVLIVDDSPITRKIIARALASVDIDDVIEAQDGVEALEAVADHDDLDVVLMDWNMPRMNGLDAVQQIRTAGNEVPVIMVTTEAEKERVVAAIKAGADNYVVKPFTAETIIKKIAATCPEHFQGR